MGCIEKMNMKENGVWLFPVSFSCMLKFYSHSKKGGEENVLCNVNKIKYHFNYIIVSERHFAYETLKEHLKLLLL